MAIFIKDIDDNIITINKLLECKIDYKSYKPDFTKQKIEDLYHEALIMDLLNINQWEQIFKILKHFLISENGKFSLYKISGNKKKSILATALGMEIMVLVAQKNPELKEDITPILKKSVDSILKSYAVLNDDMIVFLEKNIGCYQLNYHIIKSLKLAKKVGVDIPSLNNILYQLLNYFNTFKYEMISNIDNTFYLLNIYKLLDKIPLMNISPLFTSKIILNIFDRKEMFNKLKYVDFYEKLNNFLVFLSVFFITPDKFPYYFYYSFIYNLYFLILYLIFFKCHDDKNFALFEEKV